MKNQRVGILLVVFIGLLILGSDQEIMAQADSLIPTVYAKRLPLIRDTNVLCKLPIDTSENSKIRSKATNPGEKGILQRPACEMRYDSTIGLEKRLGLGATYRSGNAAVQQYIDSVAVNSYNLLREKHFVQVDVDSTGRVTEVKFPKQKQLSGNDMRIKNALMAMPLWNPIYKNGKPEKSSTIINLEY